MIVNYHAYKWWRHQANQKATNSCNKLLTLCRTQFELLSVRYDNKKAKI